MSARGRNVIFSAAAVVRPRRDWRDSAACRDGDLSVFFPIGEDQRTSPDHGAAAKRVCETCPVRQPCLSWAMAVPELYGVWGGTTAAERRQSQRGDRS